MERRRDRFNSFVVWTASPHRLGYARAGSPRHTRGALFILLCLAFITPYFTTHAQNSVKKVADQQEPAQEETSPIEAAEAQLKKGEYEAALAAFNKLLTTNGKDQRAQRGVLLTQLETGKYVEAETTAKKYLAADANNHFARA